MIELVRIIENQAALWSYRATQNEETAYQLELLIEKTKPKNSYTEWHPLIATPFRYQPPHQQARFRPPYGKNVFYGSFIIETVLYEHAFHFMKERMHLKSKAESGIRTIFSVDTNDQLAVDLNEDKNCMTMMDKNNYTASHQYIREHPEVSCIIYPSCRDPHKRNNAAILDIKRLNKNPKQEFSIKFFYDNKFKRIKWLDYDLPISWDQVS